MIEDINKKERKHLIGKEIQVRMKTKRHISRPTQNLLNIYKTIKISKQNITAAKHHYMHCSKKNTSPNI